ncbi:iron export ABC transporter permease subunit FetB [Luteibacter flocculans]|uniref:Iron export ABC transporter permease subunit FetB n=1 Tax=Luteibacter flocculans TaxID=2780091 RepID=A0ABY4T650_9GAMM|nr:iron export ABC transporter permease subunit FetB [Luteibacter flocculans]URL59695.1 iron export ABC transporter permease subunit FetB [Luteibacter flocculans]
MGVIALHPSDLAVASLLILGDALISLVFRLRFHRSLIVAAARMVVQLVAIGFVLRFVFAVGQTWLTLTLIVAMVLVAAREAAARPSRRLRRGGFLISLASVATPALLTCLFALLTAIRPHPLLSPQYAIPLAGIILGNVLNAASIAFSGVFDGLGANAAAIEARLMLGDSYRTAIADLSRDAIRRSMIPIVNQMSAAGVVTLPGIMTGQILAGLDPMEAVKYQILLMFLLAGGSCLASVAAVSLATARLTDPRGRLRLDRLADR